MAIITTTDLGQYLNQTLTAGEITQAQFAIDQATAMLSSLLCFNVDPTVPASAVPSKLSAIGAGSCGTVSAGTFKAFKLNNIERIQAEPFTGTVRQVIIVPNGRNFTGLNTCTSGITFVQSYQYDQTFNGKQTYAFFNRLDVCDAGCLVSDYCTDCHSAYIDADWGWGTTPSAVKSAALEITKDVLALANNAGLEQENIEGHSYTYQDMPDYKAKFADLRRQFGACNYNAI